MAGSSQSYQERCGQRKHYQDMRRGTRKTKSEYIKIRISQLKSDMLKAHDEHDKKWYYRLIQELKWVDEHE